jgi:two-component sensor histidine kinase
MAAAYVLAVRKARRFVEAGRYRRRMITACGLAFLAFPLMLFVSPVGSAGAPAAQFIRAVSYFLLYKSIVAQSLLMPYRRMFGESRRKRERLEALNAELQAALEEKTVLLKEVHHRVKNNLQLISSLLNLEAAHCENPELSELLRPSQERVSSMALVYEQLIESERLSGIDAGLYAKSLLKSIQSYFPASTLVEEEYGMVVLSLEQTTSLGLILDEALLNAVKHGLNGDRDRRRVALRLKPDTEGWALLEVEDDGPGLPPGVNPATASSFGLFLIRNLSRQLRGEASWSRLREGEPRGLRFSLRFPVDGA